MTNPDPNPAIENARNWLRLLFHGLACERSDTCLVNTHCKDAKNLLTALVSGCSLPTPEAVATVGSTRNLLLHYVRCQDGACPVCASLWDEMAPTAPSSQQQQQQSADSSSTGTQRRGSEPGPARGSGHELANGKHQPQEPHDEHDNLMSGQTASTCSPAAATSSASGSPSPASAPHQQQATSTVEGTEMLCRTLRWLLATLFSPGQVRNPVAAQGVANGKALWYHMLTCTVQPGTCGMQRCAFSKQLLLHRCHCSAHTCEVCTRCCAHFARRADGGAGDDATGEEVPDLSNAAAVQQLQDILGRISLTD